MNAKADDGKNIFFYKTFSSFTSMINIFSKATFKETIFNHYMTDVKFIKALLHQMFPQQSTLKLIQKLY